MAELKREGKVRSIGLSNHDVGQVQTAEVTAHVESLQPPFSMIHREAAETILPWCEAHQTAALAYSPMQFRRNHEDFTGDNLRRNPASTHALRPVADRHKLSVDAIDPHRARL